MWNCPVCDRKNDTPFCPVCGFDRSADAEAAPTFTPLSGAVPSAAGLRRERSALTLCPDCGSTAFSLEQDSGLARCRICGHVLRISPAKKTITAIAAGDAHTAVLYSDGTVRCVGKNNLGQCNTGAWRDIVAISAGYENTLGLRSDGTVVAAGNNYQGKSMVHTLSGIRALGICKGNHTLFLCGNGTAAFLGDDASSEQNIKAWRDLTAVSAGAGHSLGLKRDGTVLSTGLNSNGRCDTQQWRDIVAISAGSWTALGLKRDGTAVATGHNEEHQCDVSDWKDLIQLAGGKYFSAGLRRDGTVCTTSASNIYPMAGGWTDIIAIAAGFDHLVGLRADGTLVSVGVNDDGQCNTDSLML